MEIKLTADGSQTVFCESIGECYHSSHGAAEEALHVFIESGLSACDKTDVNILEVGFGTGLNALLTMQYAEVRSVNVFYTGLEAYPVPEDIWSNLNYSENNKNEFILMHKQRFGESVKLNPYFELLKIKNKLEDFTCNAKFDLIYFDAFSYDAQPEMWSKEIFCKIFEMTNSGGILTTYSSKGIVKRNLRYAGFEIQRLPGALGKRHMIRAVKPVKTG